MNPELIIGADGPCLCGTGCGYCLYSSSDAIKVPARVAERFTTHVIEFAGGVDGEKLRFAVSVGKNRHGGFGWRMCRVSCVQQIVFGQSAVACSWISRRF